MSKAGDSILAGINDAIAIVNGDESRGRAHKIINSQIDVKAIREKLKMTQAMFAETYGISIHSLRKWENGARDPEGAAKAYLTVISQRPNVVKSALENAT